MTDAKKMRAQFLADSVPVLEEIRCRTLGMKSKLPAADSELLLQYWDVAKTMILKAEDTQKLKAKNTSDVLSLLGEGKITVIEAKDLMEILRLQSDVDELPKLVEALEKANAK